jgi:tRNA-modifying protein YgfZ
MGMLRIEAYSTLPAAVIRFSGEDHFDFLQSQGTADLRGPTGTCRFGLWLDHKGRIQADAFFLKQSEEEALLVSYDCPAEAMMERFSRHIIADDVTMADETAAWRLLSLPNESAQRLLEQRAFTLHPGRFAIEADGCLFAGRRLGPGSLECLVPRDQPPPLEIAPIPDRVAEAMRLRAGIPAIPRDTGPGSLNPVEARLLDAVSFDKGCYLGQEVVARAHRLGRLTKRLVRITATGPAPATPHPLTDAEQLAGELTSVVENADTLLAIGWLKSRHADGSHCFSGMRCTVATLPAG